MPYVGPKQKINQYIKHAVKCDLKNVEHAKVKHACIKCWRCKVVRVDDETIMVKHYSDVHVSR
jgi:hypothetical protein